MEFVTFETAKKLKEKGFPQVKKNTLAMYDEDGEWYSMAETIDEAYSFEDFDEHDCVCPTISQVLKWFRKEKKLFVEPSLFKAGYEPFVQSTIFEDDKDYTDTWRIKGFYPTYEQAALAGIEYVLDKLL